MTKVLWRVNPAAQGLITDISATAVARAANRLADPRLEFMVLDARSLAYAPDFSLQTFDLIVMAQILWGLLEDLDRTLTALAGLLAPGGLMLISQHFPGSDRQGYGRELVSGPEDLSRHLTGAGLAVLETLESNRAANHHWAALIGRRP